MARDLVMRVNGRDREIRYIEPGELKDVAFASVDITPPIESTYAYQRINEEGLAETLTKELGLRYSGVLSHGSEFGPQWGFHDPIKMREEEIAEIQKEGGAYIWIGVASNCSAAKVEVIHPLIVGMDEKEIFGYMNLILDAFVRYVEDPANLKKEENPPADE